MVGHFLLDSYEVEVSLLAITGKAGRRPTLQESGGGTN
jgi:hypothetical protein